MEKQPHNITPKNTDLEVLKTHFPQCFTKEGNFDFEKFKAELSSQDIDFSRESYRLDWLGKSYARLLATDKTTTFLTEDVAHNNLPENQNSENILIKGDNLEVLKHLSNAYHSKIKMIYIDPPYNTGSDGFVYQDDRKFTAEQLQTLAGISPSRAERILEFTQSKSNSHSAWLTFMYPRLYIAKRLLTDNGVIFISIDDNEVAQLRLLCDEIFGEENFVAELPTIMNLKGNQDQFAFAGTHEYTLVYAKSYSNFQPKGLVIDEEEIEFDWEEDDKGYYKQGAGLISTGTNSPREHRPSLWYPIFVNEGKIFVPEKEDLEKFYNKENQQFNDEYLYQYIEEKIKAGVGDAILPRVREREASWRWGADKIRNNPNEVIISKTANGYTLYKKQRPEIGDLPTKKPKTLFYKPEYSSGNGTNELRNIFGIERIFSNPKPIFLIKDFLEISTQKDDLILDFFAGSGTTADAVMQLNREDGGNRKFILVQLPEPIDPKKSKTAYDFVKNELGVAEPTIFDITKERIIRSSKQNAVSDKPQKEDLFSEEEPTAYGIQPNTSTGFKIFATTPIWDNYEEEYESFDPQIELFDPENITEEDIATLLTTWKTYDGIPLTTSLEKVDLGGYTAYYGQEKLYLMDKKFATENLKNLVEKIDNDTAFNPISVVIFGHHFESKAIRELTENLKNYSNKKQSENNISVVARY